MENRWKLVRQGFVELSWPLRIYCMANLLAPGAGVILIGTGHALPGIVLLSVFALVTAIVFPILAARAERQKRNESH